MKYHLIVWVDEVEKITSDWIIILGKMHYDIVAYIADYTVSSHDNAVLIQNNHNRHQIAHPELYSATTSLHCRFCPACRTYLIATRFWVVVICPIIKCLTVLEFSFILFDLCLFITIFNFILTYVPIVTFWIFTYHKIWILLIIFCFIWNYWIINFLTCLEVFWSVVS